MRNRFLICLCLLIMGAGFGAESAWGQAVSATLVGTVTDSSGAMVPNATVTASEVRTGVSRKTNTTGDGVYTLPYLTPGQYKVEIEHAGFKKFLRDDLAIAVSATVRVDATLEPGNVTESVTVTSEAAVLQTDRAEVARNFETKKVVELPLANRSFQALAGLVAGVTPPTVDFTQLEDPQGTTFFRANGQGNSSNNTMVDGVDNTNPTLGLSIYLPSAEVVEEVHVTTSNYNAEFGRAGGAVVNVATRGGTNQLHGSLWEFHRSTNLQARNFFNVVPRPKPTYIRNEFGAAVGGPIVKNKTFYYAAYQGRYLRQASNSINSVPVDAWKQGDFSAVPGLTLFDPATGDPATGRNRTPFANNIIPPARFYPVSQKITPLIIAPNSPGYTNNLNLNIPFSYDGNSYDGRVDQNFTQSTKMFVKFNTALYKITQQAPLGEKIGDGTQGNDYTVTASVNLTHGFGPTLLTEARVGYNRYYTNVTGLNMIPNFNQDVGIQNPNPDAISTLGLARIGISGMPGIGTSTNYPLINADNLFTFVNTWSKIRGRHSFKWGGEIHRNRMDRFQPQGLNLGPRGQFLFNPGTTALPGGPGLGTFGTFGNSFAAYLLGAVDQTSRTYMPITPTNRQTQAFFFFQDTYQLSPKLTLDIGLRYEVYTTVKPRYAGGASNYEPTSNSLIVAGIGDIGLSTNVNYDPNNWAPRFGLTWRMTNKSVVRMGYGISYWTGRFGFTGGTLSTQFPTIYNVQQGATGDFIVDGSFNSLPVVPFIQIPSNGRIAPAPNQAFFVVPQINQIPEVQSYNVTYQREILWGMSFDISYVGNLGRQLPYNLSLNAAPAGAGLAGKPFNLQFGRTADVSLRADGVNSNYNALQANLTKRFAAGLTFTAAYTYSKSMDYGSDQASFTDNTNIKRHYAPSNYDRAQMWVVSNTYELPFGKGKKWATSGPMSYVLGAWQLNGIFRAVTGTPFTISADATPCNCPGNGNFADVLGPTTILHGAGPGQKWFDVTPFAAPGPNRFGTGGRNIVRGPSLINYDFSVFKQFPITERFKLEFRAEFYNLTNSPHFGTPSGNVNSGNFGEISSTMGGYGNREIQFALRLVF
jgi:hypothetical protein